MSFVSISNVSKTYGIGEARVAPLRSIDLEVEEGEFLVLLGPSGSGKSTLLNLTACIDKPDKGSGPIVVGGQELSKLSSSQAASWRSENIGYIFQDHNLVPVLSAYENVEVPLWLFSLNAEERHQRVSVALRAVGLEDRASHLPKQLSGGQRQRVAVARAIVTDPHLIVADEPTGNLDQDSAKEVLDILQKLNRDHHKTIMMVTHDLTAMARGTRVLSLEKGQLQEREVQS